MGREKVPYEYQGVKKKRRVTYKKRSKGLIKKAAWLSQLTGAKVSIMIIPENGKAIEIYTNNDFAEVYSKLKKEDIDVTIGKQEIQKKYDVVNAATIAEIKEPPTTTKEESFSEYLYNAFSQINNNNK